MKQKQSGLPIFNHNAKLHGQHFLGTYCSEMEQKWINIWNTQNWNRFKPHSVLLEREEEQLLKKTDGWTRLTEESTWASSQHLQNLHGPNNHFVARIGNVLEVHDVDDDAGPLLQAFSQRRLLSLW